VLEGVARARARYIAVKWGSPQWADGDVEFDAVCNARISSTIGEQKPGTPLNPDPTGNGRGIAYDGATTLYYTLAGDNNIYKISTAGVSSGAIPLAGRTFTCGALDWDPIAKQLWCGAYDLTGNVYTVSPATGVAAFKFAHVFGAGENCYGQPAGFIDGLAFDDDGSLWLSDDAATVLHHVDQLGVELAPLHSSTPNHPSTGLPGCNTGIEVVPGGYLELAMQAGPDTGPHVIVKVPKASPSGPIVVSFVALATNNPGIEDIAYDPNTFAPRCALWTNQFGADAVIRAYDVQCTRTIGYWKNHDVPSGFLPQYLGISDLDGHICTVVSTTAEVQNMMKQASSRDAANMLRAQLLAAKLNVAMGDIPVGDFPSILPIIADADALLGMHDCAPHTLQRGDDRAAATSLSGLLDAFNNKYDP